MHATRAAVEEGIVANASVAPSVVVNKVAEGSGNFGFNAANDPCGDMGGMM